MKRYIYLVFIGLATFIFASCEGPAGPPGVDGINGENGEDGTATCLQCHSTDAQTAISAQFTRSSHAGGVVDESRESWSGSCVRCHTSQGFIEFAATGEPEGGFDFGTGAFECKTCHSIHATFEAGDYAFRQAEAVPMVIDETQSFDIGNSNVCANCHQTRRDEPNTTNPGTTFNITSTHYGPHHGPQANVLDGSGFAEIAGSIPYPTAGSGNHMAEEARCVGCHMGTYEDGDGGHTFHPVVGVCNDCHGASETDFNYGGVQTTVKGQLETLRDLLIANGVLEAVSEGEWVWDPDLVTHVWDEEAVVYEPITGTHDMILAQAFFNWIGLTEDKSLGVHNPKYVKALLTNTIEAVQALP